MNSVISTFGPENRSSTPPGTASFQIAAHEDIVPVPELYRMCKIARKLLDGEHRVGRVIARPFTGITRKFRPNGAPA